LVLKIDVWILSGQGGICLIRVLIVDDAAFMRLAIRNVLSKNGFMVVDDAKNGQEAIDKYMDQRPDIVTMDITMPDMTGIEALKGIRTFDPSAKVVMISAMGQESMVKEAILNGAKSFIVKPFREEHIIQTLVKIAAGH
jgi:two-component system chemotaxis response regulator CheY